jgi:trehalose synthase
LTGATLDRYAAVVGPEVVGELARVADAVRHLRVQHVNSTSVGGGVAEILTRMVPLLRELGVDTRWDVIKGDREFFNVTKAIHNGLHGAPTDLTSEMAAAFRRTTEMNLDEFVPWGDVIFIHDPQPAGLVAARSRSQARWVWRCHIDVSSPDAGVWAFVEPYVRQYDGVVVSMPAFARPMPIPHYLVAPSIDPISDKNRDLEPEYVRQVLEKYAIDPGRPVVTQISRFDRLKDPLGVIKAYRLARRYQDCQLVLAGGGADDDPEGALVLQEVRDAAGLDPDIHVLELPVFSDLEINALVRGSTVVLQKSLREGFGLTVAEAMWKRKPVIGSAVGGIISTVIDGITGYLVHSPEGAARRMVELLMNPDLCRRLGDNGRQHILTNYLTTRHVRDYLLLLLAVQRPDQDITHLMPHGPDGSPVGP